MAVVQKHLLSSKMLLFTIPCKTEARGGAVTVSGNKADIIVNNCRFINTPNNGGVTVDAPEWSYGLFVNEQNSCRKHYVYKQ